MRNSRPGGSAASDDSPDGNDPEAVVDDFLGGGTRASDLSELRRVLEDRLRDAKAERDTHDIGTPRRAILEKRVHELREQVAALAQEEAVNRFVEDSVRATLAKPHRAGTTGGFGDEFDDEY